MILNCLVEHAALALNRSFSYGYFGDDFVSPGMRVRMKFHGQDLIGYITSISPEDLSPEEFKEKYGYELKLVDGIIDQQAILNEELLQTAKEIADYYYAPLISIYQAMLPPSLKPTSSSLRHAKIAYEKFVRIKEDDETDLTPKQLELFRLIRESKEAKKSDIRSSVLQTLISKGRVEEFSKEKMRFSYQNERSFPKVSLTEEQRHVVEEFFSSSDRVYLLQGVTGSGKTEVYLELARRVIQEGKTVVVLVPEIALTPLMMARFYHEYPTEVAILHSELTSGEKYDEYRRIARGKVKLVIGTRSAVFAPLSNVGLFILDEEHVESYKQDVTPCYHAREVAIFRAKHFPNCKVLLGSATPTLESRARAQKGVYHLLELKNRVHQRELPQTEIVSLADYGQIDYESSIFSIPLRRALFAILAKKEQAVLLLNRRGYSTSLICRECHHIMRCPDCEIPLVYHASDQLLKCHHCGYVETLPPHCPKCGSPYLTKIGFGIEKLEEELHRLMPEARVLRLDSDTSRIKNNLSKTLQKFANQEADILLGTQMIAKGHDFENVTFVGLVQADFGLTLPSYRASERTFQLVTQAIGRAGRGKKKGWAMIQTYMPNHYALLLAAKQDYQAFYAQEMALRKMQQYPPYTYVTKILLESESESMLIQTMDAIIDKLQSANITVIGPAIPYIGKDHNGYKRVCLIKYKKKELVDPVLRELLAILSQKSRIRIKIDVDTLDS